MASTIRNRKKNFSSKSKDNKRRGKTRQNNGGARDITYTDSQGKVHEAHGIPGRKVRKDKQFTWN